MILRNIDERFHDCALRILSNTDKAWYQYNFDKFFFVNEYGFVGERAVSLKDKVTEECVEFLEEVVKRMKSNGAVEQQVEPFMIDSIYLRQCLSDGIPQTEFDEFNREFKFSPQKPLALNDVYECLIEYHVIKEDTSYEYFLQAVLYANYRDMCQTINNMKYTINKIARKYFPIKKNSNDPDYKEVASKSLGIRKEDLSHGSQTESFKKKLDSIL